MPEDYILTVYNGMKDAYSSSGFKLTESEFRSKLSSDPNYATKVYEGMNNAYSGTGFKLSESDFSTRLAVTSTSAPLKKKESTQLELPSETATTPSATGVSQSNPLLDSSKKKSIPEQALSILGATGKGFSGATAEAQESISGDFTSGGNVNLQSLFNRPGSIRTDFGQQAATISTPTDYDPQVRFYQDEIKDTERARDLELSAMKTDDQRAEVRDKYDKVLSGMKGNLESSVELESRQVSDFGRTVASRPIAAEAPMGELDPDNLPTLPDEQEAQDIELKRRGLTSFSIAAKESEAENKAEFEKLKDLSSLDIDEWSGLYGDILSSSDVGDVKAFQDFVKEQVEGIDESLPDFLVQSKMKDIIESASSEFNRLDSKIKQSGFDKKLEYEASVKDESVDNIIYDRQKQVAESLIGNLPSDMRDQVQQEWDITSNMRDFMSQFHDPTGRTGFTINEGGTIDMSGITDPREVAYIEKKLAGYISEYKSSRENSYSIVNDDIMQQQADMKGLEKSIRLAKDKLSELPKDDPRYNEYKAKIDKAITRYGDMGSDLDQMNLSKDSFFQTNPSRLVKNISSEMSNSNSAQAAFSTRKEGESALESFKKGYLQLSEETEQMKMDGGFDSSYLDQMGQNMRSWLDWESMGVSLSDDEKEYLANRRILNSLTPLFLNNNLGITEDSGDFFESFLSGMGSFIDPETTTRKTQTQIAGEQLSYLSEGGYTSEDFNYSGSIEELKDRVENVPWYSQESGGQITGTVFAVVADLIVTDAILMNPALSAAKTSKHLSRMATSYDKFMDTSKVGRYLKTKVKASAEEGLRFEAAGTVFGSGEDELNFTSGLIGSFVGRTFKATMSKLPLDKQVGFIAEMFGGNKTRAINVYKKIGAANARGVGEVAEEFSQELVQIYNDELRERGFWDEVGERFGSFNENMKFFLSSYMMGSGFAFASPKKSNDAYNSLTEEERAIVDEIKTEVDQDVAGATKAATDSTKDVSQMDDAIEASESKEKKETTGELTEPLSKINLKVDEGDTEYKVDEDFYSEDEILLQLEDQAFVDRIESGEITVEINNPSTAVSEKITVAPEVVEEVTPKTTIDEESKQTEETTEAETTAERVLESKSPEQLEIEAQIESSQSELDAPVAVEPQMTTVQEIDREIESIEYAKEEMELDPEVIIARSLGGKGIKITPKSAADQTGGKAGAGKDIAGSMLSSKEGGMTVDMAAHKLWESREGTTLENMDTEEIKAVIIDILHEGKTNFLESRTNEGRLADLKKSRKIELHDQSVEEGFLSPKDMDSFSNKEIREAAKAEKEYINSLTDEELETGESKTKPTGKASKPTGKRTSKKVDESKEAEFESFESSVTRGAKSVTEWLDDFDTRLSDFGKETLGVNVPVVVVQAAVKAAKLAVKATTTVSEVIDQVVNNIKQSEWYAENVQGDTDAEAAAEQKVRDLFEKPIAEKKEAPKKKKVIKEEKPAGEKKRTFAGKLSKEIQSGLDKDAKTYIPISNAVTASEANAIIEAKGEDQSMKDVLNLNNRMPGRVRVVMGLQLMDAFNAKGDAESMSKAVEIGNTLSREATAAGQYVQAFSLLNKMDALGLVVSYDKDLDVARDKLKDKHTNLYEGSKSGYKSGTNKASKKAAKKVFGKDTPKTKKAKAFNMSKAELSKAKAAALKKLKDSFKGGKTLTTGGFNQEAFEAMGEYGFLVFADGVRTFKEWVAEMKKATNIKDEDALKHVWMNHKTENGKTLSELSNMASIEEVISEHFSESIENSELSVKLQETLGIDQELADGLAEELTAEFNRVVKAERKKEINKRVTGRISKKKREAIDIVSESEGSTDVEIETKIEEAFGIKKLTEDQIAEVKKLTKERDARPEGFLKDEMTREILSYFESLDGISKGDIMWSMWYASVLSGYETQALNVGSNALNLALESFVTAVEKGPKAIASTMSGMLKGMKEGSTEFTQVLSKGYSPEKIRSKMETKDALENKDFAGGKLNPFNYYKYVGRFMTAVDTAAFMAAKGSRKHELAAEMAKKEGLSGKELASRVSEILNNSESAYEDAVAQATEEIEGVSSRRYISNREKKRLIKLRATEIIDENLDEEINQKARDFGAFVTFNYAPEGVLGFVASKLSEAGNTIPLFKLVAPFTRIVANVLNQQIDYTPYGYLRAVGWTVSAKMDKSTKAKDVRDRNRKLIKATMGTVLMVGLYMIAKSYEDDEDPYIVISGKGPSDFNKKNQLYSQGWRPYSIKIGDTWISYQYTPLGVAMSYVGNWMDNEKYKELGDQDIATKTGFAISSSASGIMDMSFLGGLSGLMSALTSDGNPKTKVDKLLKTVGRTGTSFIPNLFKQIDKAIDPTIYESKGIKASILKEIPFARHHLDLKPKLNAFGQDVKKKGNRFFGTVTKDKVWLFMAENEVYAPGTSPDTKMLDGNLMTDDEFYDYIKISGGIAYDLISERMEDIEDYFSDLTQIQKQKYISKIFKDARKEAKYSLYDN